MEITSFKDKCVLLERHSERYKRGFEASPCDSIPYGQDAKRVIKLMSQSYDTERKRADHSSD